MANAGVPMLAVQMPLLAALLVPIIGLEAAILARLLRLSWGAAIPTAAKANLASTLVGVPLTWGILFGIEILTSGATVYGLSTKMGRFHSAVLQAPWLMPRDAGLEALIPVANLVLLPFYFAVSGLVEQWVVRRSRRDLEARRAKLATWLANAATYVLLLLGSVVWLIRS
jgi:hypothetical protein